MRLKHSAVERKSESSKTNTNEDAIMPLVRIDISKTASRERVRDVGNAVYNAMITVANVADLRQIPDRHPPRAGRDHLSGGGLSGHRLHARPDHHPGHLGRRSLDRGKEEVLSAHCRRNSREAGRTQARHMDQPGRFRPRGLVFRQWRDAVRPEVTVAKGRQAETCRHPVARFAVFEDPLPDARVFRLNCLV